MRTYLPLLLLVLIPSFTFGATVVTKPLTFAKIEPLSPATVAYLEKQRQQELDYLATCVALEAVGEGRVGMEAVAEVIVRRAETKGTTVTSQILSRSQFASMKAMTHRGATYAKLKAKAKKNAGPVWPTCVDVARKALDGTAPTRVPGALYFYDYKRVKPDWRLRLKHVSYIGDHRFMRPV